MFDVWVPWDVLGGKASIFSPPPKIENYILGWKRVFLPPMAFFNTFYSVSIPEPVVSADLQQLAQITTPDGVVDVQWMKKTHQVVLHIEDEWYIQPNGRIDESISALMAYNPLDLHVSGLFLFDRTYTHGSSAADDLEDKLLGCEWSDYAHDKMVFQANIDVYGMEADTWAGVE